MLLSKVDRERYGLGEQPLEVDLSIVYQDEAEELDEYGVDPDGQAWFDWLNSNDVKVWRVIVWLALARAGVDVRLAEVRFNRRRVGYLPPDESPGKDERSETSDSPTPPDSSPDTPDSPSAT
jgi:hypothetical protein